MFKPLGLLEAVVCPLLREKDGCQRPSCPFAHPPPQPLSTSSASPGSESRKVEKKRAAPRDEDSKSRPSTSKDAVKRPRNTYDSATRPAAATSKGSVNVKKEEEWTVVGKVSFAIHSLGPDGLKVPRPIPHTQSSSTQPILRFSDHPRSSEISLAARQSALRNFHVVLTAVYEPLSTSSSPVVREVAKQLAKDDALAQELEVFRPSNKHSYKNASVTATVGIKKRDVSVIEKVARLAEQAASDAAAQSEDLEMSRRGVRAVIEACTEVGTQSSVGSKRQAAVGRERGRLTATRLVEAGFVCPVERLKEWSFQTSLADSGLSPADGSTKPDRVGETTTCDRCNISFVIGRAAEGVTVDASGQDPTACNYHFGRRRFESVAGQKGKQQVWTCCSRPVDMGGALGTTTCSVGPHVFKEEELALLHTREAFVTSEEVATQVAGEANEEPTKTLPIAALDCELSYTTAGMSLTRLTVISESGAAVLDELVRPRASIIDYNTRFSGIRAEEFEAGAQMDLTAVRRALARFVGPQTILIGHGLENDLRALRLIHTVICDTTMLFPHNRGMPFRRALRELTSEHLGKIIQATSSTEGHSSAEDALMALELVRWKILNDPHNPPFPVRKSQSTVSRLAPATVTEKDSPAPTSSSHPPEATQPSGPPPAPLPARPAASLFIPAKKRPRARIPVVGASSNRALPPSPGQDGPDLTPKPLARVSSSPRTNPFTTPAPRP